ncbi:hypothetical protein AVEN_159627-1 [Araneus ventricosus]|uniref:Uncharacterized protein n=1 Tax=Araneus ventricosus TaxID=182803 RepID=A0A4Y2S8M0_ARAVE|nr:hypothetical protein AVEN_159627-1 [Araneus ventricosus]
MKPAGVFCPKLSRILPPKGAVSPSPAWIKKFELTVTQNPMTIRRFLIIVSEKYLGKESHTARFHSCRLKDKLTSFAPFGSTDDCFRTHARGDSGLVSMVNYTGRQTVNPFDGFGPKFYTDLQS